MADQNTLPSGTIDAPPLAGMPSSVIASNDPTAPPRTVFSEDEVQYDFCATEVLERPSPLDQEADMSDDDDDALFVDAAPGAASASDATGAPGAASADAIGAPGAAEPGAAGAAEPGAAEPARDAKMQAAIDQMRKVYGAGAAAMTDAELEAKVRDYLNKQSPAAAEGMKDIQNMHLAIGLPAAKMLLWYSLEYLPAVTRDRKFANRLRRAIDGVSPITDQSCFEVEYRDSGRGRQEKAYIVAQPCTGEYSALDQQEKIRRFVSADEWPKVLNYMSTVLSLVRSAYVDLVRSPGLQKMLRLAHCLPAGADLDEHLLLYFEKSRAVFSTKQWEGRPWRGVGVFINLEADLKAELANAGAGAGKRA